MTTGPSAKDHGPRPHGSFHCSSLSLPLREFLTFIFQDLAAVSSIRPYPPTVKPLSMRPCGLPQEWKNQKALDFTFTSVGQSFNLHAVLSGSSGRKALWQRDHLEEWSRTSQGLN